MSEITGLQTQPGTPTFVTKAGVKKNPVSLAAAPVEKNPPRRSKKPRC